MKKIEYDMYRILAGWGRRVIKTENAVSRMKRVAHKQYNSVCRCEKYHYVNATEEPGNLYCLHCLKKPR